MDFFIALLVLIGILFFPRITLGIILIHMGEPVLGIIAFVWAVARFIHIMSRVQLTPKPQNNG